MIPRRSFLATVATLAICVLFLAGSSVAGPRFVQNQFVIGIWSDPPADEQMEQHYREMAEANFSLTLGVFGARTAESVHREIQYCEKYGMKALVSLAGLADNQLPTNNACWGYFLSDEPTPAAFAELKQRVDSLRTNRPGKLAYINLLPNYVSTQWIGNITYSNYIAKFISQVGPEVLCMDHYPHFLPNADGRAAYCENLEVMRDQSSRADIPFWNFFNVMPYGDHSDPTEAQIRWQIYTSLAYGAKGVLYFCYWTPAGPEFPKGGAIITREGKKTRHYEEARRINGRIRNLGPTLMQLTSKRVLRLTSASSSTNLPPETGIRSIEPPGNYTIGAFAHRDGRRALMICNYDFAYSAWPTVQFDDNPAGVVEVSQENGQERKVEDDSPAMPGLQISLDAGEGRLFLLPPQATRK